MRAVTLGWGVVLLLGIAAFFIHTGPYFHLKIASWIWLGGVLLQRRKKPK